MSRMKIRRVRGGFWEGPGLLLALLGLIALFAGLAYLAAEGPRVIDGLALALIGGGIIALRDGFRDYAYASAQHSYIWPRDPDKMKPNAEFEAPFGTFFALILGGGLIIAGLIQAVNGL